LQASCHYYACYLPNTSSPEVQHTVNEDADYFNAYGCCLKYEEEFASDENKLRYVRIIGLLLSMRPTGLFRSEVAKCIQSCRDGNDLAEVGAHSSNVTSSHVVCSLSTSRSHLFACQFSVFRLCPVFRFRPRTSERRSSDYSLKWSVEAAKCYY